MNNKLRKEIAALRYSVIDMCDDLKRAAEDEIMDVAEKVIGRPETVSDELDIIRETEQNAIDNCPENLQYSMAQEIRENAVSNIEAAIDELAEIAEMFCDFEAEMRDDMVEKLEQVVEFLEGAME